MKKVKVIEKGLKKDFEPITELLKTMNEMYVNKDTQMFEWEYETTCMSCMYIYGNSTNLVNLYSLLKSTTEKFCFYIFFSVEHGQYIEVIALE